MRCIHVSVLAVALVTAMFISAGNRALAQGDAARSVAGGGVSVTGWTGKIDANEERSGSTLASAKLSGTPAALQVTTGPAVAYWNPANKAAGNYTVKATFTEPKYMNVNDHPHPYLSLI